jgi:hypothetical protein
VDANTAATPPAPVQAHNQSDPSSDPPQTVSLAAMPPADAGARSPAPAPTASPPSPPCAPAQSAPQATMRPKVRVLCRLDKLGSRLHT